MILTKKTQITGGFAAASSVSASKKSVMSPMEWKTSRRKISFLAALVSEEGADGTEGDDEMESEKDVHGLVPKSGSTKSKLQKQKRKFFYFSLTHRFSKKAVWEKR
jgi:hypothetical protein